MITAVSGPLAGYRPHAPGDGGGRRRRDAHAQPAGAEEPARPSTATPSWRRSSRAAAQDDDVKAFVVTGAGGNFCSGGDVHEIIGPLLRRDTRGLMRFTRDDRRAGEGDARLPAAGRRGGGRHRGRRRRDHRHGVATSGSARRGPRWPSCSTASGSPAATWAPAPSCRASSARAARASCSITGRSLGGEEGLAWGFFNRCHARTNCWPRPRRWRSEIADGPGFAHAMTKRMLQMEWAMSVDQAIEAEAVAQALCMTTRDFRRAYDAFVAKQTPGLQGRLMADSSFLDWPFLEQRHRAWAAEVEAWAAAHAETISPTSTTPTRAPATWRAPWARPGCCACPAPRMAGLTCASLCLARDILARHAGLADFAFAMQGLGTGPVTLFGTRRSGAGAARRPRRHRARRLRAQRARGRQRRRGAGDGRGARRQRALPARRAGRPGSAMAASPATYVVFARTGEAPGARGLSAFLVPADAPGLLHRRAHRGHGAAPAGDRCAFDAVRVPAEAMHRQAGRGLQGRDGARSTCSAPPSAPRRSASPAAALDLTVGACHRPEAVRRDAVRPADDAGRHRRQRDGGRGLRAAGLSRRLAEGRRRAARHARGPHGQAARDRGGPARSPTRACRSMAASASRAATRPRSSTARSGRCASTRAPRRSSAW